MLSFILTIIVSLATAGLAIQAMRGIGTAQREWESGRSRAPASVRWLWVAVIATLAVTAIMMVVMAWHQLVSRGLECVGEAGLCARMGLYVGLLGYGLVRMRGRVAVKWPHLGRGRRGLLPPGDSAASTEGDIDDGEQDEL